MKKKNDMEENRVLSPAEEARLESFKQAEAELKARGYVSEELTVGIGWANVFAILLAIPVLIVGLVLFFLYNKGREFTQVTLSGYIILILVLLALIVVHELLHGVTWAAFAGWKNIQFGFMKQFLTPYCCCTAPLKKGPYILGALMPLVVLGIIPTVAGILWGSLAMLFMGVIMISSAAGDILVAAKLLRYKSGSDEVLYYDHPTKAGGVVFRRA